MSEFAAACRVAELPADGGKTVVRGQALVAVFRTADGVAAIADLCPHMGASLAAGHYEDGVVTCPWHAWRFRVADGTWVENPKVKVPCYAARVVGDVVEVGERVPKAG